MAFSAAEIDALIHELTRQYEQLSHEYSETADQERKQAIADYLASVDYQLAALELEQQCVGNTRARATGAG